MSKEIWVFAEQHDGVVANVVFELLTKGRELAEKSGFTLCSVLLTADNADAMCQSLYEYGAKKVYVVKNDKLAFYQNDYYAKALADLIKENTPEIVLYGASSEGRSLAPTIAAMLHVGLTADCTQLDYDTEAGNLLQTRPAFGGNIMATIISPNHRPQMATVRSNVFKKEQAAVAGECIQSEPSLDGVPERMRRIKVVKETAANAVDLNAADIIVSGGRGLACPEKFAMIEELACELGAAVGASRATVDAGWISHHNQVGQTGKTVCPKAYIACGISGAIQHLAGMQSSDFIIAINKDKSAPIFDVADLGLVGDLNEIIPEVTKQLKAAKA